MSHLSIYSGSHDAGRLRRSGHVQAGGARRMRDYLAHAFYMHLKLTDTNLLMVNEMYEMQPGT